MSLAEAVSAFGRAAKRKLASTAASGAPEDQLRMPVEKLVADFAELLGYSRHSIALVGEATLSHLATRPDFAVEIRHALVGFIEVKAPGKGADPRRFTGEHDKKQWTKLKSLPNLIYTDPDPEEVRAELLGILARARAAPEEPWSAKEASYWGTVFPQMANWLPTEEAAQLRLQFATELTRLELA